jgi:hypothetical protein
VLKLGIDVGQTTVAGQEKAATLLYGFLILQHSRRVTARLALGGILVTISYLSE